MITAQELRIGNILNMQVTEGWNMRALKVNEFLAVYKNPEWVNPIPLSEEILLKVGFEKIPHFTVMNSLTFDLGRDRSLSIGCVGTPNEMLFLREGNGKCDDDIIALHNFDYNGKLYLHKLQNVVAMFGQELDVSKLI